MSYSRLTKLYPVAMGMIEIYHDIYPNPSLQALTETEQYALMAAFILEKDETVVGKEGGALAISLLLNRKPNVNLGRAVTKLFDDLYDQYHFDLEDMFDAVSVERGEREVDAFEEDDWFEYHKQYA